MANIHTVLLLLWDLQKINAARCFRGIFFMFVALYNKKREKKKREEKEKKEEEEEKREEEKRGEKIHKFKS